MTDAAAMGAATDAAMASSVDSVIDSHCHLHFPPLGDSVAQTLAAMDAHGVAAALTVATERAEYETVMQLARAHRGRIWAAVGVHPTTDEAVDVELLSGQARDESVLAVGETGLDFFRDGIGESVQRERFAAQISVAKAVGKPLIIHTRESIDAALDVLRAEGAREVGGVMHCYTGDCDGARRALDIGFMISFSGIVSFKNAESLREVARFVPAESYLVETDSPYLAPAPHRGKTNTPAYVRYVARAVAAARSASESLVCRQTTANFTRLFTPPPT